MEEKIAGQPFTVDMLKEKELTLEEVLHILYPSVSVHWIWRHTATKLSPDQFTVVKEAFDEIDPEGVGGLTPISPRFDAQSICQYLPDALLLVPVHPSFLLLPLPVIPFRFFQNIHPTSIMFSVHRVLPHSFPSTLCCVYAVSHLSSVLHPPHPSRQCSIPRAPQLGRGGDITEKKGRLKTVATTTQPRHTPLSRFFCFHYMLHPSPLFAMLHPSHPSTTFFIEAAFPAVLAAHTGGGGFVPL